MKWTYFLIAGVLTIAALSTQGQDKKTSASGISFGVRAGGEFAKYQWKRCE